MLDNDNDGLTNIKEYQHGTEPNNPDTDGDGYSDGYEVLHNTDPLDPNDYPKPFTKRYQWVLLVPLVIIIPLVFFLKRIIFKRNERKMRYQNSLSSVKQDSHHG